MDSGKRTLLYWWTKLFSKKIPKEAFSPFRHRYAYPSRHLKRAVTVTIFLPPSYFGKKAVKYPLLLFNDGQDLEAVGLERSLSELYDAGRIRELIVAGIHADHRRMEEYGTAGRPDYQQRGARAGDYTNFVLRELLPFIERNYRPAAPYSFAGFSLGGLSAFDIVWKHPGRFRQAGVFSGAFWWRSHPFDPRDPDAHRIAHDMVRHSRPRRDLRFWLQTGTHDESADRNNNGVIDAIDDTLDLIAALREHGFRSGSDIEYVEVEKGEHNPQTWGRVLPDFLEWGFGRR